MDSQNAQYLLYLMLICMCLLSILSAEVLPLGKRSGDADVPKCIENFDIHKDKIIRTTDSRAMGAKYLNEMDLDSRDECLRLCCETENCDVFVYEEKNAGSCYLFQCGPPEDFKCKFTHHVNYTSAINRHLLDLESQIKLTKHEQDLTKLRKAEIIDTNTDNIGSVETTIRQPTTTLKPMTIIPKILNSQTEAPSKIPHKKCSPYQFECRSTSECIAIYNACDGIPQCADGSDEGPELQCPDSTTSAQSHQQLQLTPQELQGRLLPLNNVGTPQMQASAANSDRYHQHIPEIPVKSSIDALNSGATVGIGVGINRQQVDFLRPMSDPIHPMRGAQYDSQQMAQYPYLVPKGGQNNWAHLQQQQQQPMLGPHIDQYQSKNSHIFNHKEIGLQVPNVAESSQMQYTDGQRLGNYYNTDVYGPQIPQMPSMLENNWSNNNNNPQDFRQNTIFPNPEINQGREAWNQNIQSTSKLVQNQLLFNKPATKEIPQYPETKEQEKVANDLKNSKKHFANQSGPDAATTIQNTEYHSLNDGHNHDHDHHSKYKTEYKISSEALTAIEDGIAETPSGAVLSLTLGLILTALMGVLIGCRLRVLRRRLRRGGKSYAHDADYLVNGMYL